MVVNTIYPDQKCILCLTCRYSLNSTGKSRLSGLGAPARVGIRQSRGAQEVMAVVPPCFLLLEQLAGLGDVFHECRDLGSHRRDLLVRDRAVD